jgi:hypothetical protein
MKPPIKIAALFAVCNEIRRSAGIARIAENAGIAGIVGNAGNAGIAGIAENAGAQERTVALRTPFALTVAANVESASKREQSGQNDATGTPSALPAFSRAPGGSRR